MSEKNNMYKLNLNFELLDEKLEIIEKTNKIIEQDSFLVRKEKEIYPEKSQANISQRNKEELLFHIRMKDNICKLESPIPKKNLFQTDDLIKNLDNKLWLILNSENIDKREQPLFENDIIRLGRFKFIINEIYINSDNSDIGIRNEIVNDYDDVNADSEEIFLKNPEIECKNSKFCASFHISLCECNNLIHYKCMEKYINDNVKTSENKKKTVKCYSIENFNCKYCFTPYPIKFTSAKLKEIYNVIPIKKPKNCNYIILESLGHKKDKNTTKIIYVITLNEDIIKIGRNNNNDIIIDDPSIGEEEHAIIIFDKKNNKVILKSVNNKFDTAVLIKKSLKMNEKKLYLQTGRTKFETNLIKNKIK